MKRLLLFLVLCALVGCASKQRYIEGTHLTLGAYLPFEEQLYGVELVSFTSGASLATSTNMSMNYQREYAATNSYLWGMVETREWSKSKVKTVPPTK